MDHVGTHGWESCAWTENFLASKKLYPNHQFPVKTKSWTARLKTTSASQALFVQRVHAVHKPGDRLDIQAVEDMSERAALVLSCMEETRLALPIPIEKLQAEWAERWVEGDNIIDSELQVRFAIFNFLLVTLGVGG